MIEFMVDSYPLRAFGKPDEPWLVDAGDVVGIPDGVLQTLRTYGKPLVLDLRPDVHPGDSHPDIAVIRNPVGHPTGPGSATVPDLLEMLILTQAPQLTSAVAAIAEADGPVLVRSRPGDHTAALVVALALLAAGASVHSVAEDFSDTRNAAQADTRGDTASALLHALWVLDRFNGVEAYLLHHGLRIEHFHSLRDKHLDAHDEP